MSKWVVDIHGDIEGDYKIIKEYEEPKTGHWIASHISNEKYVCSECGGACWYYDYEDHVAKSRFCPNCGAYMEGDNTQI